MDPHSEIGLDVNMKTLHAYQEGMKQFLTDIMGLWGSSVQDMKLVQKWLGRTRKGEQVGFLWLLEVQGCSEVSCLWFELPIRTKGKRQCHQMRQKHKGEGGGLKMISCQTSKNRVRLFITILLVQIQLYNRHFHQVLRKQRTILNFFTFKCKNYMERGGKSK